MSGMGTTGKVTIRRCDLMIQDSEDNVTFSLDDGNIEVETTMDQNGYFETMFSCSGGSESEFNTERYDIKEVTMVINSAYDLEELISHLQITLRRYKTLNDI